MYNPLRGLWRKIVDSEPPNTDTGEHKRDERRNRTRAGAIATAGLAAALGAATPIDNGSYQPRPAVERVQTNPVRSEAADTTRGDGAYAVMTSLLHNLERDPRAKAAFEQLFPVNEGQSSADRMRAITEEIGLRNPQTGWEITLQGGDYLSFTPGTGLTLEGTHSSSFALTDEEDRKLGYDPALDAYRN